MVSLTADDRRRLRGAEGPALKLAMDVIGATAEIGGATRLIDIEGAHLSESFYAGQAHQDFVDRMVSQGARVVVPTTVNPGSATLRGRQGTAADPEAVLQARRLMRSVLRLGCVPSFTCAPYQLPGCVTQGGHVAWSESSAVVYANAVIGARTNLHYDYEDLCAALVGRVGDYGLHRDSERRASLIVDVRAVAPEILRHELSCHLLGHLVGSAVGHAIPAIVGLPAETRLDWLRALGAAASSSGALRMFHAVGITPEAPNLDVATGSQAGLPRLEFSGSDLRRAVDDLSRPGDGPLQGVYLGTPHFSLAEFDDLLHVLGGRQVRDGIACIVNTSRYNRDVLRKRGLLQRLGRAGVALMVDACTYYGLPLAGLRGRVMTNSAKWAYYAPRTHDVAIEFGTLQDCVESAVKGEPCHVDTVWQDHLWR